MYATLSLKRLTAVLLWPFAAIVLLLLYFQGIPQEVQAMVRFAGSAIGIWGFALAALGGSSRWWAPWRLAWRLFPPLNTTVFPDLNGKWIGKTSSNWPVKSALLAAAEGKGKFDRQRLSSVPLQEDDITLEIKASLFTFRIVATLHHTKGKSHSLTERVSREKRRDAFELYYVYRQETPQPELTDEGSHLGAACLDIDLENHVLEGAYWTKRSWRSGLNTAGLIKVARQHR